MKHGGYAENVEINAVMWSKKTDPYWHLALEEYLLDRPEPVDTLLLWRSEPAVVIGRNQNPWVETNPFLLAEAGVKLARRISGGGAVYHDLGNLNFSFIQNRGDYSENRVVAAVIDGLRTLGIETERLPFGGLAVAGKKVSGQAYCYRKNGVLHHGTLLVEADLGSLERLLQPTSERIVTKAISSRRWPVTNLAAIKPGLTWTAVAAALQDSFAAMYSDFCLEGAEAEPPAALVAKHRSWAWCYGETPPFSITMSVGPSCQVEMAVTHGIVRNAIVTASSGVPCDDWSKRLTGQSVDMALALLGR